jgi:hypothetical protein
LHSDRPIDEFQIGRQCHRHEVWVVLKYLKMEYPHCCRQSSPCREPSSRALSNLLLLSCSLASREVVHGSYIIYIKTLTELLWRKLTLNSANRLAETYNLFFYIGHPDEIVLRQGQLTQRHTNWRLLLIEHTKR